MAYEDVFAALSDPTRKAVFDRLRHGPLTVGALAAGLPVSRPAISQHLKILKAASVVSGERSGREVLYRLADHHLAHIVVDAVAHASEDTP